MSKHLQVTDSAIDLPFDPTYASTATGGFFAGMTNTQIFSDKLVDGFILISGQAQTANDAAGAAQSTADTAITTANSAASDASSALSSVGNKVSKSGDSMTGQLGITTSDNQFELIRSVDTNRAVMNYKTGSTPKWRTGLYKNAGSDDNFVVHKSGGSNPIEIDYTTEKTTVSDLSVGTGATGTFTTVDSKTVTVTNGIITSIV